MDTPLIGVHEVMSQVKILVIDDDIGMTELLTLLLAPASPEILTANSGVLGLELAHKHAPDLIILDLMMPEMNGWALCRHIREFSDTPILILTAMDSPGAIAQALDFGADDYLIKPVSSGTLIAHLNKLLRRAKITLQSPSTAQL
jgi:two-component system KDP operon response regulator KdpE